MLPRSARALLVLTTLAVSLAPLQAQDFNAKVIVQVGNVSVLDKYLTPLSVGSVVKRQQVIVTGADGYAKFQVSDGSTFEVFNNAKVVFRETPGDFEHLLNIILGRVKVMIYHAPGKYNPNNVSTPTAVISVRGTVFDVDVQDEDTTVVSVDEGIVDVRNWTAPGKDVRLVQGGTVTVYKGQPLAKLNDNAGRAYQAVKVIRDTLYQVLLGRSGGSGGAGPIPGGGTTTGGGAQRDKGKGGTTTGGGPGAPPAGPAGPPGGN